jgi:glycyl-tRNA synthetase beta subunit
LFFVGLGSFQDKTDRLEHVMSWIANQTGQKNDVPDIKAMTRLCKSDLFTSMVNEFPTLQGIMGGHYAIREGYSRQQADALSQPYRLARMSLQEVQTKSTAWGAWLTIADSLDTMVGFFALGKKPTGSKDPLALRRSCHGFIKALMVHGQHLSVLALLDQSLQSYAQQDKLCNGQFVVDQWWGFVTERLEFILKESGLVLPKRAYATLVHKWRALWDTPTVWAQSKHYACVHQNHPAAVKAYDRLLSLQESCQQAPVSNQRDGLTTIWENDALTMLQEPLNIQAMDRWSGVVDSLLDQVSIQDELLGGQRLGLIDDLIHLWRVWMPLDAGQE